VTGDADSAMVIPEELRSLMKLQSIFMPHGTRQRQQQIDSETKHADFVHYTSADAALSIIRSKRIWMRNTTCMSDYREVRLGFELLQAFFSDESKRQGFIEALDECLPGAASEAIAVFDQWWTNGPDGILLNTYIASFSEHLEKEDLHGRLSMWRAFGNNSARVAIVFRVPAYAGVGAMQELRAIFSPVAYLTEAGVHAEFAKSYETFVPTASSYVPWIA
jgi:hypothetical protein